MIPALKTNTLHHRLVRLSNKSPLITFETRFASKQEEDKVLRIPTMIFVSPQEHKSCAVPTAQYDDFLTALEMLEKQSKNQDQLKGSTGMCTVSFNDITVKLNLTGIWIAFGRRSSFKIFDTGARFSKEPDAYCNSEVAKDRYRAGHAACFARLAGLIEDVKEFIRVIRYWEEYGEFLSSKGIEENASRYHLFRYVGPAEGSSGVTNLSILSEYKTGQGVKTTLCSSNTLLVLMDDRKKLPGCDNTPIEWFFISLFRALSSVRSAIRDGEVKPFSIELFKDTPEIVYENQKVYNGYVAIVPSPRGPRLVINYDGIPAYGKLSWILSELNLDEVIDRIETVLNFYPISQG